MLTPPAFTGGNPIQQSKEGRVEASCYLAEGGESKVAVTGARQKAAWSTVAANCAKKADSDSWRSLLLAVVEVARGEGCCA